MGFNFKAVLVNKILNHSTILKQEVVKTFLCSLIFLTRSWNNRFDQTFQILLYEEQLLHHVNIKIFRLS